MLWRAAVARRARLGIAPTELGCAHAVLRRLPAQRRQEPVPLPTGSAILTRHSARGIERSGATRKAKCPWPCALAVLAAVPEVGALCSDDGGSTMPSTSDAPRLYARIFFRTSKASAHEGGSFQDCAPRFLIQKERNVPAI
ncbi:hypothetical protein ERJ75_001068500 [Trypanosoma vivax]|nr:hypothetical protein ERJ75_001068500 [Trypanosoma vivax]